MLKPVLEERFGLKFHHQTKDLKEYALVIAKGGPKLRPSSGRRAPVTDSGMTLELREATTSVLCQVLSDYVSIGIVDKTGLTGKYDISLYWALEEGPMSGRTGGGPGPANDPLAVPDTSEPSLFTALHEQLGLKLKAQKGPVDVIVIDHLEEPSPN